MCYMARERATVGVRELRQNLSVYLDQVKRGVTLNVSEHGRVVAILRPAALGDDLVERLVAEGRATAPRRTVRPRPLTGKYSALGQALRELNEDAI